MAKLAAILAGMVEIAAALACAACRPDADPGPAPTSLVRADPIIVGLQPTPKGVLVIGRLTQPDLAGDAIRAASRAVRQLDRAVQAGAKDLPPYASVLTFDLYGVDVDKAGNRTPARLFSADFDVNDLRNADLGKMGPAKVLNLAIDLRIDHAGIAPINAWCMRYPHAGSNYCEMAGF